MDQRVAELHCIMPIANVQSVLTHGILSYERAEQLTHASVAMQPVQDLRDQKRVPRGLKLHQYANLYFHARNPMLFLRRGESQGLCVLRVSLDVLATPDVVITDSNAASAYARFLHPSQWALIDFDDVLADNWTHPDDQRRYYQHKSRKCAEVLVPHRIPPELLLGARVNGPLAMGRLAAVVPDFPVIVDPDMFFQQ